MSSTAFILAIGFVTPAFLAAGALLVAVPIIIHLLNRRRFKTIEWAAMDFLLRAMRKNRRKIRFEQWLLLAMRCAVLLLLGMALARPVACEDTSLAALAGRRAGLHVIVLDNSYSMAYESDRPDAKTNFDQAKIVAKRLIDRLSAGGESVAIVTASRPAATVIAAPTYDLQQAKAAIDRIEQSYSGTDLVGALQLATKIGQEETKQPNKSLYLLTDSTRSAWAQPALAEPLAAAGRDAGKLFHITHFNLSRANQNNAAVVSVQPAANLVRRGYANDLSAMVLGFGDTRDAVLQWKLDDQTLPGGETIRPTPEAKPITQSRFQLTVGGPRVVSVTFAGDDRLKIDDTRNRVIDVASEAKVLIVEGERGAGSLGGSGAFLMEALAPAVDESGTTGSTKRGGYLAPELISDLELGNRVLGDYRAVILAGVGQISPTTADQLKRFVEAGGALMIFVGEAVTPESYNGTLLPRGLLPGTLIKRVNVSGGQAANTLDFNPAGVLHPLLKKFSGLAKTGLDRAAIYTYWQVDIGQNAKVQRVLNYAQAAGATSADPAITMHDLGAGHVLFVSTSAYPDWSSLPSKLNFAPLVHELLGGTMSSGDAWMNLTVGDELRVPANVQFTSAPQLKDPQQVDLVLEPIASSTGDRSGPSYRSRPLTKPGVYTLVTGAAKYPVAVNVPSDEADVRPIDENALRKALGDIDVDFLADSLPAIAEQQQRAGNDFGWSVMLAVLCLVGAECFFAMRFGHYRRSATGGSPPVTA